MKKKYLFWISSILICIQIIQAQPSTFDPNFGKNGFAITNVPGGNNFGSQVVIQSDGKTIEAGNIGSSPSQRIGLLRYKTNGTLDSTFGTNGVVNLLFGTTTSYIYKIALDADEKILLVGQYNTSPSTGAILAARLNHDGSIDNAFAGRGYVNIQLPGNAVGTATSLALISSGGIILGGAATNSSVVALVVKLKPTGYVDSTFGTNGITETNISSFKDIIYDLTILPTGKVLATASSKIGLVNYNTALIRYNANGLLDNTFGTSGIVTNSLTPSLDNVPVVIKQTPTGKFVVGGYTYNGSNQDFILTRYLQNGTLDNTFNSTGIVKLNFGGNDVLSDFYILKNGNILALGQTSVSTSPPYNTKLVQLDTMGSILTNYANNGTVTVLSNLSLSNNANEGSTPGEGVGLAVSKDESVIYIATSYNSNSSYPFYLAKLGTSTGATIGNTNTTSGSSSTPGSSTFGFYSVNDITMDLTFIDTLGNVTILGNTGIKPSSAGVGNGLGNDLIAGLELDKRGVLYFLYANDSLYTLNRHNGKATYISVLQNPGIANAFAYGMSFNSKNNLYVWFEPGSMPKGKLTKVTNISLGTTTTLSQSFSSFNNVFAIKFDDNDSLWTIDDCCLNKLSRVDTTTGLDVWNSPNMLNRQLPGELEFYNGKFYGTNVGDQFTTTSTGFFVVNKNGTSRLLFSLPGHYIGLAAFNNTVYSDTVYITQTITVTSIQTLTVTSIVTVYDCGTITGTDSAVRSSANISVFPNPSSTTISVISSGGTDLSNVTVLNAQGNAILSTSLFNAIDVSPWPKGIYLLEAKDGDGHVLKSFKILKE